MLRAYSTVDGSGNGILAIPASKVMEFLAIGGFLTKSTGSFRVIVANEGSISRGQSLLIRKDDVLFVSTVTQNCPEKNDVWANGCENIGTKNTQATG